MDIISPLFNSLGEPSGGIAQHHDRKITNPEAKQGIC
jgi:hypothetical protein